MDICVDVTELMKVKYISGIQRVVKEITIRWIENNKNVLLLSYDFRKKSFIVVDNAKYSDYHLGKSKDSNVLSDREMKIEDFNENHIFFDIDSVWMNPLKRSYLLPKLKERGTKIVAHIYDIIPVTDARYCDELTTLNFLEYADAHIQYADLIISNAKATGDAIRRLIEGTEINNVKTAVVKLGSDIRKSGEKKNIRKLVCDIADGSKYILMVGTLEPRKNHAFVLNAFDKGLFAEGLNLVIVGRVGWNVDDLLNRIKNHPMYCKQLFYIDDSTDSELLCLYENTLAVAFASYNEGFGLPIIEAFSKKALVLAADKPVLREIGQDYCDYFSLDNVDELISLVKKYNSDPEECEQKRAMLQEYIAYTWDECAEDMYSTIVAGMGAL